MAMPEMLAYRSDDRNVRSWIGDFVLVTITAIYAIFNVVLMMLYAHSILGPTPFPVIYIFLGSSIVGVLAGFPIRIALRYRAGVTWRGATGVAAIFTCLIVFNFWCL
jgi:hypothetical protein